MSIYVLRDSWQHTWAENTAWEMIVALGDAGCKEAGISWHTQDQLRRFGRAPEAPPRSERAVRDAIRWLEDNVEIETRIAQRGRRRINVYRVLLGRYGEIDLDDLDLDLPFTVTEPWSRPAEVAARRAALRGSRMYAGVAAAPVSRPAESAARRRGDDRQLATRRPATSDRDDRQISTGRTSYRDLEPSGEPAAATAPDAAAASDLQTRLQRLGVTGPVRMQASLDPDRAVAWLDLASTSARDNAAGFFVAGWQSGEWPSPRGNGQDTTRVDRVSDARRASLENLVRHGAPDEARYLIDVEWTLTSPERAELHLLVDELQSDQLPDPASTEANHVAEVA